MFSDAPEMIVGNMLARDGRAVAGWRGLQGVCGQVVGLGMYIAIEEIRNPGPGI